MPSSAASRLPNGTPEYVMALHRFFFPGGANSETIAPVVADQGADADAGEEPAEPEHRPRSWPAR